MILIKKILQVGITFHLSAGLLCLIMYGLGINYLLPQLGINNPLEIKYVWPSALFFLPFFTKFVYELCKYVNKSLWKWFLLMIFIINPILAVYGAIYLDNTGSDIIAMASVMLVCVTLIATYFQHDNSCSIIKPAIYSAGLSLLLANSMRSDYLVGWDIHQEFYVFRLTSMHNLWDINTYKDAYNACLSITILPTIIHNLTGIAPLTIMKLVYPMIIAFLPVIVFQIGDRLSSPKIAYVGAFAFLLQAQFMSQLPALTRQGVAFIFFASLIDSLLIKRVSDQTKNVLFVFFGIGMIFSHYSTTYVALTILLTSKVLSLIIGKLWKYKELTRSPSIIAIAFLFAVAFFWNVMITGTTGGLTNTMSGVASNIKETFSIENKSDFVKSIASIQRNNANEVRAYSHESIKSSHNPELFKQYEIVPVSLSSGKPISLKDPIAFYFHALIPWVFRISILFGFGYILLYEYKYRQSTLILGLALAMFGIAFAIVLLPSLSQDYNFERLFQQILVLLAPICAIGFYSAILKLRKLSPEPIIGVILLSYLLLNTGLIDKILYERTSWLFSKSGEQYYRYYTTSQEIRGIYWLDSSLQKEVLVYADRYTKIRFIAFSDHNYKYISTEINPPVIMEPSYVFSGYAATNANAVFAETKNGTITFSFPYKYLSDKKNIIYSNSTSKIYK